jgi:hypothetical protein
MFGNGVSGSTYSAFHACLHVHGFRPRNYPANVGNRTALQPGAYQIQVVNNQYSARASSTRGRVLVRRHDNPVRGNEESSTQRNPLRGT